VTPISRSTATISAGQRSQPSSAASMASTRSSAGTVVAGGSAARMRWTRPSRLVTEPAFSTWVWPGMSTVAPWATGPGWVSIATTRSAALSAPVSATPAVAAQGCEPMITSARICPALVASRISVPQRPAPGAGR